MKINSGEIVKYLGLIREKGLLLVLKFFSLGVKFYFFSLLLPKLIAPEEYGNISLSITTITFFIFIVGFDFYNFSHREIISLKIDQISNKLVSQLVFSLAIFLLAVPIFYGTMAFYELKYIFLALVLLYTEYLGQEIYRVFILFSKPILGNILLFFKSSVWIFVLLFLNEYLNVSITIFNIFLTWSIGNALLILFTLIYVKAKVGILISFNHIEIKWIVKGLKVSIPFLLNSICLKSIELSDRYFLGFYSTKIDVGVYSFYSNMANSLNVLVNTAVVIMIYPKILKLIKNSNFNGLNHEYRLYEREILIVLVLSIIGMFFGIDIILSWVGKEEYYSSLTTFWVLIGGSFFYNMSLAPHILLYGFEKDRYVILPVVLACLINLLLNWILVPKIGMLGAGIATIVAFLIVYIMKYEYVRKIIRPSWPKR